MDLLAIGLVVFSAVLHAGWNILGKSNSGSGLAFTMKRQLFCMFHSYPLFDLVFGNHWLDIITE